MSNAERPIVSERVDVTAWIGGYPFRDVPHPEPEILARVLVREGFTAAWVGHLPGAFYRDPVPSNAALYRALAPHRELLTPTPIVRPDWPGWERTLQEARDNGAAAIRVYPQQWGLGANHPALSELTIACGEAGLPIHITCRFEDLRQRHPLDGAGDVPAATIRAMARIAGSRAVLVVAGASRELIEETHWGLTPAEQSRVFYDFHWVWGPPDDHFAHLVQTLGPERLAWSSWWPLRLSQQSQALVDLLPDWLYEHSTADALRERFADGARIAAMAKSL